MKMSLWNYIVAKHQLKNKNSGRINKPWQKIERLTEEGCDILKKHYQALVTLDMLWIWSGQNAAKQDFLCDVDIPSRNRVGFPHGSALSTVMIYIACQLHVL